MTDPFESLRAHVVPVDPDPAFAATLRARLERALLAPEDPVTTTLTETPTPADTAPNTITSYLAVLDARASVEFYVGALGATRRGEPIVMPDGRIGHVEVQIGNSVVMLADEFPEIGLLAPVSRGGASQSLHLETADPDGTAAAAVALGARLERPVADGPYGRTGVVVDPDGHRWMISRAPAQARPGDVVYASVWAPDGARARRFYGAVLDREIGRGLGVADHPGTPTLMCCYVVPDADAAAVLVRAAGGTAGEPHDEPYGRVVDAVDDQGVPFALVSGHTEPPEAGPGSLAYTEIRVPDAVRARAFYGTVLGWRFVPGGQAGFWHPASHAESTVLSGGHAEASVVPWFRVADVTATAAAVRDAGGTAEPADSAYGAPVACTDDQGTPFSLVIG